MHWLHGLNGLRHHARLTREQRHEPFTPRVPAFVRDHPTLTGAFMAAGGIAGNWVIVRWYATWPNWMMFPGMLLAVLALVAMMLGLGILTIRVLEPAVAMMDFDWDAEPLAALGIPLALQRKCEQLGFWAAEDLVKATQSGKFPWVELAYDERMQVERAAQRWAAAIAAEKQSRRGRRWGRPRIARRSSAGE